MPEYKSNPFCAAFCPRVEACHKESNTGSMHLKAIERGAGEGLGENAQAKFKQVVHNMQAEIVRIQYGCDGPVAVCSFADPNIPQSYECGTPDYIVDT